MWEQNLLVLCWLTYAFDAWGQNAVEQILVADTRERVALILHGF